jgi:hypothetical protein
LQQVQQQGSSILYIINLAGTHMKAAGINELSDWVFLKAL